MKRTPSSAARPSDNLIGVVGMALVADVIEPTDLRSIACHDPVVVGGGEQATKLRRLRSRHGGAEDPAPVSY